jgi:hypothetical protein
MLYGRECQIQLNPYREILELGKDKSGKLFSNRVPYTHYASAQLFNAT